MRQAITESERLSQLLKYFKSNGFALEKSRPPESVDGIIEKSDDGGMAVTGFVIFPLNSDDAANEAALLDRNPASAFNARCNIAMFVPGIWAPPNTPDGWQAPAELERHADRDSAIMQLFRKYDPKKN
jgi:hypothetical protein